MLWLVRGICFKILQNIKLFAVSCPVCTLLQCFFCTLWSASLSYCFFGINTTDYYHFRVFSISTTVYSVTSQKNKMQSTVYMHDRPTCLTQEN
jgi:hypothetical protein